MLRKNKIFNKSRYSRNRQTTRVAFYLSALINILVIFGVFVLYYKILFKLGQLWVPFFIFLASFLFSGYLRTTPATYVKNTYLFLKTVASAPATKAKNYYQVSVEF